MAVKIWILKRAWKFLWSAVCTQDSHGESWAIFHSELTNNPYRNLSFFLLIFFNCCINFTFCRCKPRITGSYKIIIISCPMPYCKLTWLWKSYTIFTHIYFNNPKSWLNSDVIPFISQVIAVHLIFRWKKRKKKWFRCEKATENWCQSFWFEVC